MSKIQTHEANSVGTDYICADIHGHFHLLEAALEKVDFDFSRDRVFSLGDLIDRGPESQRALEFLGYPWFLAILGNHEIMLLDAFETDDSESYRRWFSWGGLWAEQLTYDELIPYYEAFVQLPVAREVTLKNGKNIGLVHAELPDEVSWPLVKERLASLPAQQFNMHERDIARMLWAKTQVYRYADDQTMIQPITGIDHVFHGHTIVHVQPETIQNRTFMDLGSYETGEVGFINPLTFLEHFP